MNRGEVSDSIPTDLILEILSRLPAKSIARFRCVSKLWRSMFLRPYFTELFLTRSSAWPPRLLFIVGGSDEWSFFTLPQPQNQYEKSSSSLVVTADFHMKFHGGKMPGFCNLCSGLIYFTLEILEDEPTATLLCNPSTGQKASLPLPKGRKRWASLLGFDPIDKQFKLLSYETREAPDQILTLGAEKNSWRKIHCPVKHSPYGDEGICINGVLYYLAIRIGLPNMIVCFDVRSEKFIFIYRDFFRPQHWTKLVNYKGKLGVISLEYDWTCYSADSSRSLEVCMYVIKDVEKPESSEWSKCFSSFVDNYDLDIVGVTISTGEIVLSTDDPSEPFYVFFLNPERNTCQRVEINGFRDIRGIVKVFVDHVEDLKFITI